VERWRGEYTRHEVPDNPELHLKTDKMTLDECVDIVTKYIWEKRMILPKSCMKS